MRFSWDNNKDQSNLQKHGVSFEAAKLVFEDPFHLSWQDQVIDDELRWKTLGAIGGVMVFVVAHTFTDEDGIEQIRIISARQATKVERRNYEQNIR